MTRKKKILTFEKVETANVWPICLYLKACKTGKLIMNLMGEKIVEKKPDSQVPIRESYVLAYGLRRLVWGVEVQNSLRI